MAVNITTMNTPALASATSANGTVRTATAMPINSADPGALLVQCTSAITTSGVAATFTLQTSYDNSTWFDVTGATFTTASGTGSAVTTRQTLALPLSAWAHKWVRVTAVLAGAATGSSDVTSVNWSYVSFGKLFGMAVPT